MAFEKINSPAPGANWGQFQPRTNKLTNPANVQILRGVWKPGCEGMDVDIDLTYLVAGGGATTTFTQNSALSGLKYYKIYLTDGIGNEVQSALDVAAITTPVAVDTSTLDPSQDWCVKVIVSMGGSQPDCNCENTYNFDIGGPSSNPTDTIETADIVGALAVTVEGVAVASGGSAALAAAAVDDVVTARIGITNATANSLVTVSTNGVTGTGDGSFAEIGYTPITLDDATESNGFLVSMDTTSAGAKTFTVTIVSNDAASPYTFDITLTVA